MKNVTTLLSVLLFAALPLPGAASERLLDEASGIEFVRIPAGCFPMGADAPGELKAGVPIRAPGIDEVPRHEVCVDAFWLGRSEVTIAQWLRVMESMPSGLSDPVANISWNDAVSFTGQLTTKGKARMRLPTEAEWEYACHAGVFLPVTQSTGDERGKLLEETYLSAWYRYQSGRNPKVHPVMDRKANAWGLHDMLGNVWEWTADNYDETAYARHAKSNPRNTMADERRVLRGGSYLTDLAQMRCGARSFAPAEERTRLIGFRVVREIDAPKSER